MIYLLKPSGTELTKQYKFKNIPLSTDSIANNISIFVLDARYLETNTYINVGG